MYLFFVHNYSFVFVFLCARLSFLLPTIHPSTFFCPSTPCLCLFSRPHRLPADNPRGVSSGPAAGGAGRRDRCVRVFLPSDFSSWLHHSRDNGAASRLFFEGRICHTGDQDHQNHQAHGHDRNTARRICVDRDKNSPAV